VAQAPAQRDRNAAQGSIGMSRRNLGILAASAIALLAAGIWLNAHRTRQQSVQSGERVFPELADALGDVDEIRISRGDGSRTTLRRSAPGWTVVERNYPADPARVRDLALALVNLEIVERKTSDPANYPKLGVEAADSPTAASTLVEIVAGGKSWPLIVGRGAEGRAVYVRKPAEAASALAEPTLTVDPDPKRWIDRLLTDIPGAEIHDISVKPATGPAYLLTRASPGDADLTLSPIPRGRAPLDTLSSDSQAQALVSFNFDDVRATPAPAPGPTDRATFRTFDGQVVEFAGRREGDKAYVTVAARRDEALASKFAPAEPAPDAQAAAPAPDAKTDAAKPAARTVERLGARTAGVEYEIPVYKYETLFKPQEALLEKK
jgi:hypothetical protein